MSRIHHQQFWRLALAGILCWLLAIGAVAQDANTVHELPVEASASALDRYSISGTVTNHDGKPLELVAVVIHETNASGLSDAKGHYRIENVKPGSYHLHAQLIGYSQGHFDVRVENSDVTFDFHLDEYAFEIPEVAVEAGMTKSGEQEASVTIDVADENYLDRNMGTSLIQSMEGIAGVQVQSVTTGVAKPVLRGLSSNRVVTTQNGIKQEGQQWGSDHGLEIDQFDVGAVEVIKGPMSVLYGSDGLGGVINIKPHAVPEHNRFYSELVALGQTNSGMWAGSAMAQVNKNGWFGRARYSQREFGDYQVPADTFVYNRWRIPIYNNQLKNTAGKEQNASGTIGLNRTWGVSQINVSRFQQEVGFFPGAHGRPDPDAVFDDGDSRNIDYPRQSIEHTKAVWNTNLLFGSNWLEADLGYQNNIRTEYEQPFAHGNAPVPDSDEALKLTLQTLSGNVRYHHTVSDKTKRIYGLSGQLQENRHSGFEFLLPNYDRWSAGAYVFQETQWTEHKTVNASVRFDAGQIDIQQHLEPVYSESGSISEWVERSPDIQRLFYTVSGGAGISWYKREHINYKLNIGSSFRYPTPAELASNGTHHGAFRFERGDADLSPERGYQTDFSLIYKKKKVLARFTPFFNYFHNFIFLRPTGSFATAPGASGQVYEYTQAQAIHTGTEMVLDWHALEALHVGFGLESVFGANLDEQRPLPMMPPTVATVDCEYERDLDKKVVKELFVRGSSRIAAPQNLTERNEPKTPGFVIFGLSAGCKLFSEKYPVEVNLQVRNLLNSEYYNHLSRYRLLNLPEPGRNVVLMLRVPFVRFKV